MPKFELWWLISRTRPIKYTKEEKLAWRYYNCPWERKAGETFEEFKKRQRHEFWFAMALLGLGTFIMLGLHFSLGINF